MRRASKPRTPSGPNALSLRSSSTSWAPAVMSPSPSEIWTHRELCQTPDTYQMPLLGQAQPWPQVMPKPVGMWHRQWFIIIDDCCVTVCWGLGTCVLECRYRGQRTTSESFSPSTMAYITRMKPELRCAPQASLSTEPSGWPRTGFYSRPFITMFLHWNGSEWHLGIGRPGRALCRRWH